MSATPPPHGPPPRKRLRLGLGVVAAVGFAIALVIVLSSGGGGGSTPTVAVLAPLHHRRVGPEAMFTSAAELTSNPSATLDQLQRLGVDRVHVYLHWSDVAPDPTSRRRPRFNAADPAAYPATGWANFDTILHELNARRIGVDLALVTPPPFWASGSGAPVPRTQTEWRPSAPEFEQFVRAVGIRYSGHYVPPGTSTPLPRVGFWSIWNEPNFGVQLAPQAIDHGTVEVSPTLYRKLVDAAWTALGATGHAHDTILIGELDPAGQTLGGGPGNFNATAPLRFVRALYCVGPDYRPLRGAPATIRGCPATAAGSAGFAAAHPGLFHASGFADHPYPQGLPPNAVTPNEPDFAELASVSKLERTLDVLQRVYGSRTRFPIWSTEFGYQTTPPDTETGTVSPTRAAYYLNWSEYLTWLDPRLRSYDQYLLADPAVNTFATGLETSAGVPKPGYYAYRMPIFIPVAATREGHPLEVWGCVRPASNAAATTHRPQSVSIQFRPAAGGSFRTVRTVTIVDRYGYFDVLQTFGASGAVRLSWSYPNGPQIFSRTVDITLR